MQKEIRPVSYKRWEFMILKNQDNLRQSLTKGMNELFEKAEEININAKSFHIFYMRTGVYIGQPFFRLYLFDEQGYNGLYECWTYWNTPELMNYMELLVPMPVMCSWKDNRLPEIVIERKRKESAENLYLAMGNLITYIIDPVMVRFPQINHYVMCFGGYMDEPKLIRR